MEVIQHDVRRLDRLITDISDASRLDAELARGDAQRVDMRQFLGELSSGPRATPDARKKRVEIEFTAEKLPQGAKGYNRAGSRSSSRPGHHQPDRKRPLLRCRTIPAASASACRAAGRHVVVAVEDNGPGIRADNIDRIFERFYTDRPAGEDFGQNSGLGLSISRQIVEAHGGTLTAENIPGGKPGEIRGARFVMTLPAEG